ncbi:MAG: DUF2796 domain-containing protein [Paracoccaceae bacterium]
MSSPIFRSTANDRARCALAVVGIFAAGASHADEPRSAAAHQHGTIAIEIAVEGGEIQIALYAPGADIVGFEHTPSTDADKQAVENARAILSDPFALFGLPDAAGCAVEHASVSITAETAGSDDHDHDHDHEEGHDHAHEQEKDHDHAHEHDDHAHGDHDHGEAHFEFIAEYHLECADIGAVDALTLRIFEQFPNSQTLNFTILGESGATAVSAERGQTSLTVDFGG